MPEKLAPPRIPPEMRREAVAAAAKAANKRGKLKRRASPKGGRSNKESPHYAWVCKPVGSAVAVPSQVLSPPSTCSTGMLSTSTLSPSLPDLAPPGAGGDRDGGGGNVSPGSHCSGGVTAPISLTSRRRGASRYVRGMLLCRSLYSDH